jgi:hypothetical protein
MPHCGWLYIYESNPASARFDELVDYSEARCYRVPGMIIRHMGSIGRTATVARNLPAHRRGRSIEVSGHLTKRRTGSNPSRDIFSLSQGSARRQRRRAAGGIPPRVNNKHRMELCGLSKARPISCSDCPAFHRYQMLLFSIAESPNRFPGLIHTTFREQTYTRWCCIDRLSRSANR